MNWLFCGNDQRVHAFPAHQLMLPELRARCGLRVRFTELLVESQGVPCPRCMGGGADMPYAARP